MRWLFAMAVVLLAACSSGGRSTPSIAYRDPIDRFLVGIGLKGFAGYYPCTKPGALTSDGSRIVEFVPIDQCYRFKPPERIDAIWHNEFEGSMLLTRAELGKDMWQPGTRRRWLEVDDRLLAKVCGSAGGCREGDYHIVFVGRRTQHDGAYGHFGAFDEMVLLDRLISMKRID